MRFLFIEVVVCYLENGFMDDEFSGLLSVERGAQRNFLGGSARGDGRAFFLDLNALDFEHLSIVTEREFFTFRHGVIIDNRQLSALVDGNPLEHDEVGNNGIRRWFVLRFRNKLATVGLGKERIFPDGRVIDKL